MTTALDNLHVVMLESLASPNVDVTNYKNKFHTLTTTTGQIYTYKIPNLNDPSTWPGGSGAYYSAQKSWNDVTYDLQNWANTTLKKADLNISEFTYDDVTISPRLTEAISCAEKLIQNPNDTQTKTDFTNHVAILHTRFGVYVNMSNRLTNDMVNGASKFETHSGTMGTLAQQALAASNVNKQSAKDLADKIKDLENEIESAKWAIAGGSLATALGVGIGILALVLAPATGGVSLVLLIPAGIVAGGGGAVIALNAAKMSQLKAQIDATNNLIKDRTGDATLLETMSNKLTKHSTDVKGLKEAINDVRKPWVTAEQYFKEVKETCNNLSTTQDWQDAKNKLTDAKTAWASWKTTFSQMKINQNVSTSSRLTIGMTNTQVSTELETTPKIDIFDYLAA